MSRIQIHSIELKDYRQYIGTQKIPLKIDGEKNINVIEGENGSGKSNLLNAITFCLYNTEEHLEESREEGLSTYPYANREALREIEVGDEINGYVEVRFGRENPEYRFKREFTTVKNGENEFGDASGDFTLQQKEGTNWEIMDDPNATLNQILPVDVRDYFLFDGERLDTFFEEEYAEKVEKGIVDVSHIDLLDRAKRHLNTVRDDLQEGDNFSGKEDEIRSELHDEREELESLESDLDDVKGLLSDTTDVIREKEAKLEGSNDKYIRNRQDQRSQAKERLKELQDREDELKNQSGDVLTEAGPIVYSWDALEFTLDQINELYDKGKIPPRIQEYFIRELLERDECICGEKPLTEDHVDHLEALLEDVAESLDEDEDLEAKSEIPRIKENGSDKVAELLSLRKQLQRVEREQDEKQTEINEITEELKQYDTTDENIDVDAIERQLEEAEARKDDLKEQKGRLERDVELQQEKVDDLDEELTEELEKRDEHRELVQKLRFMGAAIENVGKIRKTVLKEIRDEAEAKVEQYFNQLIWKPEEYEIKFKDDYTIEVLDEFGMDKIGSLSAGEKQVLALSFMSALTSISGFEAPIVIDTPLGRISGEPRNRIAENIPDYIEDTQLTFLMTDSEYTTQVESRLKDSVANEYLLRSDGLTTEVVRR